jgi:hypothetical protein
MFGIFFKAAQALLNEYTSLNNCQSMRSQDLHHRCNSSRTAFPQIWLNIYGSLKQYYSFLKVKCLQIMVSDVVVDPALRISCCQDDAPSITGREAVGVVGVSIVGVI